MKTKFQIFLGFTIIFILGVGCATSTGTNRFFKDQTYNYQVLRAFGQIPYGGADTGEILSTINKIKNGDDESWYQAWVHTATRVEKMARELNDPVSRGRALLRAHNYYRTAEFLLHPKDSRRIATFRESVKVFNDGLDALNVQYELIDVPYGEYTLKAIYYPGPAGSEQRPLIVVHGGYDSTLEELYFGVAAAAVERGYSCLTYEGPGQGSIIREKGLQFTHEWETPNRAVLDEFLNRYPRPGKIILIGVSLGGYLAPRAAAFDPRIDGVVAFGVCYDFQEAALRQVPKFMTYLYNKGFTGVVNTLAKQKMKTTPGVRWGFQNAQWTMGVKDPADLLVAFDKYNLRDVSKKITCDVLILAGEKDHFFPTEQVEQFSKKLVNARSVTARIFTEEEGGHEHCQEGALMLAHGALFDWVEEKFER